MPRDNGTPFSSVSGLGISKLSVKWMRLSIVHERIEPGKPTQNGRHERLHRTLKEDTASPPAESLVEQRDRFVAFQRCFNEERPHQALLMQTPASLYRSSARVFPDSLDEISYDGRHITRPVRKNGTIRWKSKEIFVTEVLRRERIGLLPTETGTFEVYFGKLRLGVLDSGTGRSNPNNACLTTGDPTYSDTFATTDDLSGSKRSSVRIGRPFATGDPEIIRAIARRTKLECIRIRAARPLIRRAGTSEVNFLQSGEGAFRLTWDRRLTQNM